jgi:ribosomal-protein-alanine N-acetyltransferase
MIHLTTERLVIRDPLPTDINDWHRLLSDPKTMYYLLDIMTRSLDESQQNLEAAVNDVQNPDRIKYFFAIEDRTTGAFIGTVGYTVTQNTPLGKLVGAGYFILPEYHGRGYMTEALKEVVRFAFEDNGVYRINTGCLSENRASERVMQKCGMIREAERKGFVWHDGRMKDRVEYRLLKNEWLSMREMTNGNFWFALDKLVAESEIVIDRPKGSAHPRYPNFIYPLDYGYLKGTTAMDGGGIDVWHGSDPVGRIDAIMCIVDLMKRDSEIKVLIGCTEDEKTDVYRVHNETEYMKGVLIRRDDLL